MEIPLNDFQLNVVREIHRARDEHLAKGSKMVTFKSKLTKKFTDACKKLGIYESKKTTLHCLRHTFAVKKYLETRDIYEVCKRLNHDKLSTTLIYSKFSWKRLEQDFPTLVPKQAKNGKNKLKTNKIKAKTNKMIQNYAIGPRNRLEHCQWWGDSSLL